MAKGVALAIGLNSVDPTHYAGWDGPLDGCENDASDMTQIAVTKGFQVLKLLTNKATRVAVLRAMDDASQTLQQGDIFMLTYSGHGGQLPDRNSDEDDLQDETWCLYDGELVDDELYAALAKFKKGVRIVVLSDSCHSGTVTKVAFYAALGSQAQTTKGSLQTTNVSVDIKYRAMPPSIAARTYQINRDQYEKILTDQKLRNSREAVQASALLISGCQDNQLSADGPFNGLFTGTLLRVWNGGTFKRNYKKFHTRILASMPPDQSPNYFFIGIPDTRFEQQVPFTI